MTGPFDTSASPAGRRGNRDEAADAGKAIQLRRLRLLVALDALLVAGSVKGAAEQVGLSVPAMSRLLGQIRDEVGDPIFIRSGKRLTPTPRAEEMRLGLRRLMSEVEGLLDGRAAPVPSGAATPSVAVGSPVLQAPPLAMRPSVLLEGQPTPADFARRLADLAHSNDPRRRLARLIALIGFGVGHSRPLTSEEAEEALSIILAGEADPLQIGAFLQVMHYRGETAHELAGMVTAARAYCEAMPLSAGAVDLDWPACEFVPSRRPPWFLQAAGLVAKAGYRILIHGSGPKDASSTIQTGLARLGIPRCESLSGADEAVRRRGIAYLSVAACAPQLHSLLRVYPLVQTRSPLHRVVHLLNPLGAPSSLLGVARVIAITLSRDAAALLGWPRLSVLASVRDVAEFVPFKPATLYRSIHGNTSDLVLPCMDEPPQSRLGIYSAMEHWEAVWRGDALDPWAEAIVVATAAVALLTIRGQGMEQFGTASEEAQRLWKDRHR